MHLSQILIYRITSCLRLAGPHSFGQAVEPVVEVLEEPMGDQRSHIMNSASSAVYLPAFDSAHPG